MIDSSPSTPSTFMLIAARLEWHIHRHLFGKTGMKIMEEDWDNLLIIDACRYDLFEMCNDFNNDCQKVVSAGSHTTEFLKNNFTEERYRDTIYISATPRTEDANLSNKLYDVINVWDDGWDEQLGTVPPKTVADRVREVEKNNQNKRLIAHFVQPHYPFIGEKGQKISKQLKTKSGLEQESESDYSIWDHLANGNLPEDEVWKAYEENLHVVLPVVSELIGDLYGKSVITSDHGNSFDTRGIYGHPPKKFFSELVTVPWVVFPSEERKHHVEEETPIEGKNDIDQEVLMDRLSDLGYKD